MEEICRIIEKALELEVGSVSVDGNVDTIEEWDSLGFLSILSALEERFGNKVATIDDLASVKSVKEITNILRRESII
ncbi:acyl carrier protein [Candidatus Poribacteria bacterium]